MISSRLCEARYGKPNASANYLLNYQVPPAFRDKIKCLPHRIFCHKDLIPHLNLALLYIINRDCCEFFHSWDGCFNIRESKALNGLSIHSWGLAIDINAKENGYHRIPTMNLRLVACFKDAGFDWGGDWQHPDGMHFQLSRLPVLQAQKQL